MARRKTPEMTRYEAEALLGLTGSYSYRDFQKAFKRAVRENHPDAGGDAAAMVRVNQARDVINYYFGDDRDQALTCAPSQEASAQERHREAQAQRQEEADAARDAAWAGAGFSSTDNDYTAKKQSEWTVQDWDDFEHFRVPASYLHEEESGSFADYCASPHWQATAVDGSDYPGGTWDIGNLGVGEWERGDWYYFWFANALFDPPPDHFVHVRQWHSRHLRGPWAQREAAMRQPDYAARKKAYKERAVVCDYYTSAGICYTNGGYRISSPYGHVAVNTDYLVENVGVPFAYATANHHTWRQFNEEHIPGVPRDADWAGLEFLLDEDRDEPWIAELGLQDKIATIRRREGAATRKKKQSSEGMATCGWIARHQTLAGWLFVALVYTFLPALTDPLVGVIGSVEAALVPAFAIQVIGLIAAIAFRKRVVRGILRVQHRVFGKV